MADDVSKTGFFSNKSSLTNDALNYAVAAKKDKKRGKAFCWTVVSITTIVPSVGKHGVCVIVKVTVAAFALTVGQIPPIKKRTWSKLEAHHLVANNGVKTVLAIAIHAYQCVMFLAISPFCCVFIGIFSPEVCKAIHDKLGLTYKNEQKENEENKLNQVIVQDPIQDDLNQKDPVEKKVNEKGKENDPPPPPPVPPRPASDQEDTLLEPPPMTDARKDLLADIRSFKVNLDAGKVVLKKIPESKAKEDPELVNMLQESPAFKNAMKDIGDNDEEDGIPKFRQKPNAFRQQALKDEWERDDINAHLRSGLFKQKRANYRSMKGMEEQIEAEKKKKQEAAKLLKDPTQPEQPVEVPTSKDENITLGSAGPQTEEPSKEKKLEEKKLPHAALPPETAEQKAKKKSSGGGSTPIGFQAAKRMFENRGGGNAAGTPPPRQPIKKAAPAPAPAKAAAAPLVTTPPSPVPVHRVNKGASLVATAVKKELPNADEAPTDKVVQPPKAATPEAVPPVVVEQPKAAEQSIASGNIKPQAEVASPVAVVSQKENEVVVPIVPALQEQKVVTPEPIVTALPLPVVEAQPAEKAKEGISEPAPVADQKQELKKDPSPDQKENTEGKEAIAVNVQVEKTVQASAPVISQDSEKEAITTKAQEGVAPAENSVTVSPEKKDEAITPIEEETVDSDIKSSEQLEENPDDMEIDNNDLDKQEETPIPPKKDTKSRKPSVDGSQSKKGNKKGKRKKGKRRH